MTAYNPEGALDTSDTSDTGNDTDDTDETGETGDTNLDPLAITDVSPPYGSNAGGYTVVISGGPFDDSARVTFAGPRDTVEGTVEDAQEDALTVTVPASSDTSDVDVIVVTDTREGELTDGFIYWPDATDQYGLTGALEWFDMVGNYWGGAEADFGDAWLVFLTPTPKRYAELWAASAQDQCESDYVGTSGVSAEAIGAADLTLRPPTSGTIVLDQDATTTYLYWNDTFAAGRYVQGGAYALDPIDSPDYPAIEITNILEAPNSFSVTAPNISGSSAPTISRTQSITWSGSGGDFMVMQFRLWNSAGTDFQEIVTCWARDDGNFSLQNVWTSWTSGRQVDVLVGRAIEGTGTLPHTNAKSGMVGIYWVYGAGFAQ
jgi:hypothetical protein